MTSSNRSISLVCLAATLLLHVSVLHAQEGSESDPPPTAASGGPRLDGKTPAERGMALMRYVATCRPKPSDETYPKAAVPAYAARLMLGVDTDLALKKLDAAAEVTLKKAQEDPFDKVALVNAFFLCKDKIPTSTARKIRDYCARWNHKVWQGYGAMNYRLMEDGAGFLAAEEWPEIKDADGLDADQIKKATGERLYGYFDRITTQSFDEYGCPIYLAVDLSAIRMLAEFAREPQMRQRAGLTLDAMMIDIACTWNRGYNIGSAARAKYWGSTDTGPEAMGSTAAAAWVWFGAPRSITAAGTGWIHSFWMATPGTWKLPTIVAEIANDRAQPFVTYASCPGYGRQNVHRMTYHSLSYGLCSQFDQCASPTDGLYKEARRHMLKWVSDKGSSTFAVCMDNPRRPYNLKENVANAIGYGENPFAQYLQHEGTLIGVYAVPEDYPYYKLYAPFPTGGSIVKRLEKSGWVFCHNGSMLMAFHSVKPYTWAKKPWSGNDMLWVDARKDAWVLETSELKPFVGGGVDAELARFAEAVLAKTKIEAKLDPPAPRLCFTSITGHTLDLTFRPHRSPYTDQSKVDGKPVDYTSWPTLASPWVRQEQNSPILQLNHGGKTLMYDFAKWSREER